MLPVKKKTIEVSYIETKPFVIKIPSFLIPTQYIKISSCVLLAVLILGILTSFNEPVITEYKSSVVAVAGLPEQEEYFVSTNKVIPITDIIPNTKENKRVLDFICTNRVLERAYKVQQETGLKVATIISQKGVESAWNNSSLCKKTKNYGNIKCFKKHNHAEAGCVRAYDKKEGSNDWYVKANTNWEGWAIYKELIDRKFTKAANQDDVYNQIVWLKKKRYASDPNYVSIIWNTIRKYNLLKLQEYIDDGYTITSETGKYIFLKPTP